MGPLSASEAQDLVNLHGDREARVVLKTPDGLRTLPRMPLRALLNKVRCELHSALGVNLEILGVGPKGEHLQITELAAIRAISAASG